MKVSVVRARSFGPEGPQDDAIPRGGMAMGGRHARPTRTAESAVAHENPGDCRSLAALGMTTRRHPDTAKQATKPRCPCGV